jgi:hypothetical protein
MNRGYSMLIGWKRLRILLLLPIAILLVGTIGFMVIEKLPFVDALYFTIVTISTVGYGDIHPTTMAGKLFGIILIIIGIGTFLTIVTSLTQSLVARGQDRLRKQRLNMLIGLFFTEVGNQLLKIFVQYDPNLASFRSDFLINNNWSATDFGRLKKKVQHHEYTIDRKLIDLESLSSFLKEKDDIFIRQIENPDLTEHESFAELLWAAVHLRDELVIRSSLINLPDPDLNHLANDAKRAYNLLVRQWLDYLQYLKRRYPYLFSLALRTNPFGENSSPIIEIE